MSNGSEHTPERCVHAVDGPDWAGLREPTSWKERAIAAEEVMLAIIDATSGTGDGPSEAEMVAGVVEALTLPAVAKARAKLAALERRAVHAELEWSEAAAQRDILQARLDATEAVITKLKEIERLSAQPDWPGWNALKPVWRIIRDAPAAVVPEGDANA
jgi:hypothetical protein